jgi:putative membrane protein
MAGLGAALVLATVNADARQPTARPAGCYAAAHETAAEMAAQCGRPDVRGLPLPGVQIAAGAALVAALVIGLFNAVLRPILVVLTLPVTVVTLGLFLFVINALMFWAAAELLKGFQVTGFGAALLGSLIYSALGMVIDSALRSLFPQQ